MLEGGAVFRKPEEQEKEGRELEHLHERQRCSIQLLDFIES